MFIEPAEPGHGNLQGLVGSSSRLVANQTVRPTLNLPLTATPCDALSAFLEQCHSPEQGSSHSTPARRLPLRDTMFIEHDVSQRQLTRGCSVGGALL